MKFRFSHHAQFRIFIERGISAADIKSVINRPDTLSHFEGGVVKARKNLDRGLLCVVYSKDRSGTHVIITAYFI